MLPKLEPVTAVKRHATEILARLRRNRVPVLITEHGRASAVLLDLETYQSPERRLAVLECISRGEKAIADGRVVGHTAAMKRLAKYRTRC